MGVSLLLIILKVLLWAVAAVAALLLGAALLVLFVPIGFRARAEGTLRPDDDENWDGSAEWEADLAWGGRIARLWLKGTHQGIAEKRLTILGLRLNMGKRRQRATVHTEAAAESKSPKPTRPRKKRRRPTFADIQAYAREGLRLVRRLSKALRLHIAGDVTFGFEDPSLTGFTLGALALTGKPADLTLRPDWFEPGLEGWVKVRGRVYGIEVAIALWQAYWRSPLSRRLRRWIPFTSYGR